MYLAFLSFVARNASKGAIKQTNGIIDLKMNVGMSQVLCTYICVLCDAKVVQVDYVPMYYYEKNCT